MHIAVLDENIADRKHLERLLDRESDRRIRTTGNLYIDSYGATDTLLSAPLRQYDFFMIDLNGSIDDCVEVFDKLRERGVSVPVCLMKSEEEFKTIPDPHPDLLYLPKPIIVRELSDMIETAIKIKKERDEEEKTMQAKTEQEEDPGSASKKKGFFKNIARRR